MVETQQLETGKHVDNTGAPPAPMPTVAMVCLGAYFLLASIVTLYLLIRLWPTAGQAPSAGWVAALGEEGRLLLIVALSGMLGSCVHSAQSFVSYVGNRQIVRSWLSWYLLRPFIGLALAEVFYFVVRGGFFTGGAAGTGAINPFGLAALGGLTGMFSKEATDKLREVFKNLFRTEEASPRKDKLKGAAEKP